MLNKPVEWFFLLLFFAITLIGLRLANGDPMAELLILSVGVGGALPVAGEIYHGKGGE